MTNYSSEYEIITQHYNLYCVALCYYACDTMFGVLWDREISVVRLVNK